MKKQGIKFLFLVTLLLVLVGCGKTDGNANTGRETEKKEENQNWDDSNYENNYQDVDDEENLVAQYISNRTVDYDEANSRHRVFWGFSTSSGGEYIRQDADIKIKIVNDDGETVYDKTTAVNDNNYSSWTNKTWDTSRLLGVIYINDSEIKKGSSKQGVLIISATLENGVYFDEETISIYDLPLSEFTLNIPTLPMSVSDFEYSGDKETTVEILGFTTKYSNGSVSAQIKAKMTYNNNGNTSSDYAYIGYKVKDSEGMIVDSGSFLIGPLAVGDIIMETGYLSGDYKLGESYTIEFIDTK